MRRNGQTTLAGREGFTLVELLVVISILALIVGIILPAYVAIQRDVYRKKVISQLALLESGCKQYQGVFGAYPPGGAGNLLKFTTGIGMGIAGSEGGFRVVKGGRVYGPYVDVSRVLISGGAFSDGYGGKIGYWSWNGTSMAGDGSPNIANATGYVTRNGTRVVDMFTASAGPNQTYSADAWTLGTDDLVTFVSEN